MTGCAALSPTPQSDALARGAPPGLAPRAELEAVPFFPQTPYHCGPAALATTLVHAGFDVTPEALAERVFLPAREGSLQVEMLAAARSVRALAVLLPGTLDVACGEVAAGRPLVVLQNLGLAVAPRWHYAVLVGYDLRAREVLLRSGTTRREAMAFELFERTWARGGHWLLATVRPGDWPVRTREDDAVSAATGFERVVVDPALRLRVYASLVARWPDSLPGRIGEGNAHAGAGDWRAAAGAFEQAARRHDSAAAWHNLALSRWTLGERDAARSAAQRALERARASEPAWREAAEKLVAQFR